MKDYVISCYLFLLRTIYAACLLFTPKSQTTCIVTYGDNVWPIANQLASEGNRVYIFYDQRKAMLRDAPSHRNIIYRPMTLVNRLLRLPYLMATSSHAIMDNYIVELASFPIRLGTKRFQVWHAAGALKSFGLHATQNQERGERANKRFRRVYQQYGQFVVPGMECAEQFSEAHDLPLDRFVSLGMPRTDHWYHLQPMKKDRLVIYAPTYRENTDFDVISYIRDMQEALTELGFQFMVKLHPAVELSVPIEGIQFIEPTESIMPHLIKAEWVITDYSSIPFEACLFNTKIALFVPDFDSYSIVPGVVQDYETLVDAPIVKSVGALVDCIEQDVHGDLSWASEWYDDEPGFATSRIIEYFYQ
ncbi:CDP-glycerol glycerophosphotransferase family protein [Exiguobacterium sp. s6]|uniref:CDP-glycerol glycerophosphotransferase family protein n=1 Tax=Exiguobacterium sp. s6 TaxID=2751236 RepID=UPI001BE62BCE|nr:CDP-glycerol glycerophosphotransferase family protein [Exiguobacterium sp. s6]